MRPREVRVSFSVRTDAPLTYLRRLHKRIAPEIKEYDGHHFEPIGTCFCDVAESSKRSGFRDAIDASRKEAKAKRAGAKSKKLQRKKKQ